MAYTIYVNGNGYPYPETGDTAWGNNATEFAKAVGTALSLIGLGQTVNVNGSIVKIDSTTQGIYIPRVATGSLPAGTKDKSLLLYNSTNDRFEYWNGSSWAPIAENASGDLTVARDLTVTRDLIVDTDVLKTDATNNRVGINTASPTVALDVTGSIKSSATVQSVDVVSSGTIQSANGTATAPGITFSGDTNTGIYNIAADTIGFSANGAERARIDSNGIELIDGTAANPSISFSSDTNTGIYRSASDQLSFSTGGVERHRIASTGQQSSTIPDLSGSNTTLYPEYKCRAWLSYKGTVTRSIYGSGNVSSVTVVGTGVYEMNFTTNMPDTNYSVSIAGPDYGFFVDNGKSTNKFGFAARNSGGTTTDADRMSVQVFR